MIVSVIVSVVVSMRVVVVMVVFMTVAMVMVVVMLVIVVVVVVMLVIHEWHFSRGVFNLLCCFCLGVRVAVAVAVIMSMVVMVVVASQVVMTIARVQDLHLNQIKEESHHCHSKHCATFDLGWLKEPFSGFSKQPDCHNPN